MASQRYDQTQLGFYVERAVADSSGNRFFASDPLELVVYIKYEGTVDDVISISGHCRGATRNAGGTGSIVGYHIEGLYGTANISWGRVSHVSGVVMPVERINNDGFAIRNRRQRVNDIAFLRSGVNSGVISVTSVDSAPATRTRSMAYATIKAATSSNPMRVLPSERDLERFEYDPKNRSFTEEENYQFDDGSILFEDFVFYGNYAYLS